jgi:hypothetical protein
MRRERLALGLCFRQDYTKPRGAGDALARDASPATIHERRKTEMSDKQKQGSRLSNGGRIVETLQDFWGIAAPEGETIPSPFDPGCVFLLPDAVNWEDAHA